jgi:hypothetical protein
MKKAFLVEASVMTRVIIDVPDNFDGNLSNEDWDKAVKMAMPNLRENVLCEDNIANIKTDIDCPFGTFDDDLPQNELDDVVNRMFYSNGLPIVCRGDYESLPIPMYATEIDDDNMVLLAKLIFDMLHIQYGYSISELESYFGTHTNNDEDLDTAYWREMEECAISIGMRYYEDMTDEEYEEISKKHK